MTPPRGDRCARGDGRPGCDAWRVVLGVSALFLAVAGASADAASPGADGATGGSPSDAATGAAAPGGAEAPRYSGDAICRVCHQELAEAYDRSVHGVALAGEDRPAPLRGCEACHGPGSAHAEAGGGKGVGGLHAFAATEPAAERSAVCLTCHAGAPELHAFKSSTHAVTGTACTDCHGGHGTTHEALLRAPPPGLCYTCHLDVRAQFLLPEHHGVNEGVVGCSDCHEPHGSRNPVALREADTRTCYRCHAEIEGPFVFEHAAVLTEGCAGCHTSHGSVNRHLLEYQQVAQLCYRCHTVTPSDHVQPSFRQCTTCHVSIHGSNTDPRFLEQ